VTPTAGGLEPPQPQILEVSSLILQRSHHRIGSRPTPRHGLRDNFSPSPFFLVLAWLVDPNQHLGDSPMHTTGRSALSCGACRAMEIVDEKASPFMVSCLILGKCISRRSASHIFRITRSHHLIRFPQVTRPPIQLGISFFPPNW
jgi:hypothetical protein